MKSRFFFIRFQLGLIIALAFAITAFSYKTYVDLPDFSQQLKPLPEDDVIDIFITPEVEKAQKQASVTSTKSKPDPLVGDPLPIDPDPSDPATEPTDPTDPTDPVDPNDPDWIDMGTDPDLDDGTPMDVSFLTSAPVFPGCENVGGEKERFACFQENILRAVHKELKYPKVCRELGIQGMVIIEMVFDINGDISDVRVLRNPDDDLSEEAVRAVESLRKFGRFAPGTLAGKPRACAFRLPVNFKLGR